MHLLLIASLVSLTSAIGLIASLVSLTSAIGPLELLCSWLHKECCDGTSVHANISLLESSFEKHVHGQHIAQDIVVPALQAHFAAKQPTKALVLSFHGPQGSGKTFVSKLIAEAVYKHGVKSKYFRQYTTGFNFPDSSKSDLYKINLRDDIIKTVTLCERAMFVFDDVRKMPCEVLDVIKPFIDYHEHLEGVDYRRAVFIFLSNTGASFITEETVKLWKEGWRREDINLRHFESLIRKGALNEDGGFFMSENVSSNLIDYYIPFLPLEEKHVKLCIRDAYLTLGIETVPEDAVRDILEVIVFKPDDAKYFSISGCKRLHARVGAHVGKLKS